MTDKRLNIFLLFSVIISGSIGGCNGKIGRNEKPVPTAIMKAIEEVRERYRPDSRTAIFDIWAKPGKNSWVLAGETNMPEAKKALIHALNDQGIFLRDSIMVLPENPDSAFALVRVSVANLRAKPSYAAELVTQATLGLPLRVYKKTGGWYRVQTPDSYIAWINGAVIIRLTKRASDSVARLPKIIFLDTYGFSYESPMQGSDRVSDLVTGDILTYMNRKNGYIQVGYPDGRAGWIPESSGMNYIDWLKGLRQGAEDLVRNALTLKGIPYMWGGTSAKMMDCSGFTKTVFFLNGMIIPRDASQQARTGILVDTVRNYQHLQPGDLLFFGRKATTKHPEKVVHVGLWLGDGRFIHASGTVHISSLIPGSEGYDDYNDQRYLKAKRLQNSNDKRILNLKKEKFFRFGE